MEREQHVACLDDMVQSFKVKVFLDAPVPSTRDF